MPLTLHVNGAALTVDVPPDTPLLYVLRNDLSLNGPKFGCGLSQCGACTVQLGHDAVRSCTLPVSAVGDKPVRTVEGLGTIDAPHPLQSAFAAEQAGQCGYCLSGMLMTAAALLDRTFEPLAAPPPPASVASGSVGKEDKNKKPKDKDRDRIPTPSDAEIRAALDGNLCRCGSHLRILRAVHRAIDARVKAEKDARKRPYSDLGGRPR